MSQRKSDTLKTYADLMEASGLLMEAALYGQEETHPDVLTYDSREVKAILCLSVKVRLLRKHI